MLLLVDEMLLISAETLTVLHMLPQRHPAEICLVSRLLNQPLTLMLDTSQHGINEVTSNDILTNLGALRAPRFDVSLLTYLHSYL